MSEPEHVRLKVIKSGAKTGSLMIVLTKQLKALGVKAGDLVGVTWDNESITIRRAG